jgi:hypothetical protein
MPLEVQRQIDRLVVRDIRKDERGEHVEQAHLDQDRDEIREFPMLARIEPEARPPCLGSEEQDEAAPDQRCWIGVDPAAGKQ